jgi:hypothetical protein
LDWEQGLRLEMVLEQVKIVLREGVSARLLAGYFELESLVLLTSLVSPYLVGARGCAPCLDGSSPSFLPALIAPGELSVKDLMLQQDED